MIDLLNCNSLFTNAPKTNSASQTKLSLTSPSSLSFISSANSSRIVILILCLHFYSTCLSFSSSLLFTLRLLLFSFNLVYFIAFFSLFIQVEGLLGMENGILSINEEGISMFKNREDASRNIIIKYILKIIRHFWFFVYKHKRIISVTTVSFIGLFICFLVFIIFVFFRITLILSCFLCFLFFSNFLLYLSFRCHGKDFLTFQWDVLLLEGGILCIVGSLCICTYSSLSSNICVCAFRLLVFKLMFSSGICKYASGCRHWISNTAMNYYFWTQPLPNIFSWPCFWLKNKNIMCIVCLVSECFVPFLIFGSKSMRIFSFIIFAALMISIYMTGNYGFFTFLAFVLSLSLLDDSCFYLTISHAHASLLSNFLNSIASLIAFLIALFYFLIYTFANVVPLYRVWHRSDLDPPKFCSNLYAELSPIHACNLYGLFATITTYRHEIVVEELHKVNDKMEWIEINFKYKPGKVSQAAANLWWGHMPRLDWRLWFIPLRVNKIFSLLSTASSPSVNSSNGCLANPNTQNKISYNTEDFFPFFFKSFLVQLIKRSPSVLNLLGDQKYNLVSLGSPRSVRISLYDYRFIPPENLPMYCVFFPDGIPALLESDIRELNEELKHWERGAWWIRKRIKILEVLHFKTDEC